MGVLGKSRQGFVCVINNILTNLLTSEASLMLPTTGLPNYKQLFIIETVHTMQLMCLECNILSASQHFECCLGKFRHIPDLPHLR